MRHINNHMEMGAYLAPRGESQASARYVLAVGAFFAVAALIAAYFV